MASNKAQHASNRITCRYCAWSCARFRGRKPNNDRLLSHVIATHEDAFVFHATGDPAQTLQGYLDWREAEDAEVPRD
jgi:SH3-like domain-containing protein